MFANSLMVAVGIVTILWSRWLLPRQMRAASKKAIGGQRDFYDEMVRQHAEQTFDMASSGPDKRRYAPRSSR